MDQLKEYVSRHRMVALLALFALIVFVGFSITSAIDVAHRRAEQAARDAEAGTGATEEGGGTDGDDGGDIALSESQEALVARYDARTKSVVRALCSGVWSANGGKHTLRFYDTYYVETANGETERHPYAISAYEPGNDGADVEIDTIVFETERGTHIATYTLAPGEDGDEGGTGTATLSSSTMFALGDAAYERTEAAPKVELDGLGEEGEELLGDATKLAAALGTWCSTRFPAATRATWGKSATIDYETGVVVTAFALGGEGSGELTGTTPTVITVTYDPKEGSYEFGM